MAKYRKLLEFMYIQCFYHCVIQVATYTAMEVRDKHYPLHWIRGIIYLSNASRNLLHWLVSSNHGNGASSANQTNWKACHNVTYNLMLMLVCLSKRKVFLLRILPFIVVVLNIGILNFICYFSTGKEDVGSSATGGSNSEGNFIAWFTIIDSLPFDSSLGFHYG